MANLPCPNKQVDKGKNALCNKTLREKDVKLEETRLVLYHFQIGIALDGY